MPSTRNSFGGWMKMIHSGAALIARRSTPTSEAGSSHISDLGRWFSDKVSGDNGGRGPEVQSTVAFREYAEDQRPTLRQ